ncbi:MAG: hypothetical protein O3C25_04715, partial [Chloroflexi bacterium]|nr:hypothetical protein [Chloroflexota bacterium]
MTLVLVGAAVAVCFLVTTGGSALALEHGRLDSLDLDAASVMQANYGVDGQRLTLPALKQELTEAVSDDARELEATRDEGRAELAAALTEAGSGGAVSASTVAWVPTPTPIPASPSTPVATPEATPASAATAVAEQATP